MKEELENKRPMRVLIIEDTPERQKVLTSLYRSHAWILVDSCHRAIRLIQAYQFDLISMDYNIRGDQDGDSVAAAMQESPNKDAKVIIHSMNPKGADKLSLIMPDAIRYPVNKMITSNSHFNKLRNAIDKEGVSFNWLL
jgi:CheY-like chemotaxis protein